MGGKVSNQAKKDNDRYTKECREIYNNLKFAKIEVRSLYDESIMIPLSVVMFVLLATSCVGVYCTVVGLVGPTNFLPLYIITLIWFLIIITVIAVHIGKSRRKGAPRYFVRDGSGIYEIYCKENQDGELVILTIINLKNYSALCIEKDGSCGYYKEFFFETAENVTGFYQFLAQPTQVFDKSIVERDYFKYKKKKVDKDQTIYYFTGFGRVLGSAYPRSLVLKNGVVFRINEQKLTSVRPKSKSFLSYAYDYSGVNSDEYKLHLSDLMMEEAKKQKFTLPQESENIIYPKE
ncbi:MAG: hypothetical protein K2I30_02755 [Clostridia bacterium]|nr:hypothetical protein [Clostridia bacterium]